MNIRLYLQIDENTAVTHPHVYLSDIAKLSCSSPKILNRLRVLPIMHLDPTKPGRYVMSVMDLIRIIQQKEPDLEIVPLGQPDFIITYEKETPPHMLWRWCKVSFVCLASFFGAAFSIMTFHNDVDLTKLFHQIYTQVTGQSYSGFSILEISYSIGLGLGVLFFFNHFGHLKITSDPTPLQVQMRLYENDVNTTIIEDIQRKEAHQK